jgi:hypothetical protein
VGFLGNHISRLELGSRGDSNNRSTSVSLKSLGLSQKIQEGRPMLCHRTLEDWIFRHWITEIKEFI